MIRLGGQDQVIANLIAAKETLLIRIAEAVEKSAVLVANHAKDEHKPGFAHAIGRYENRTTNLTNSIMPEMLRADQTAVEAIVYTNKEYGPAIELGRPGKHRAYPFMVPALKSQDGPFQRRCKAAIHGNP